MQTNEIKLEGKVMNIFEDRDKMFITLRVMHDHFTDGHKDIVESFFRFIINDSVMIRQCRKIAKSDKIRMVGHLKLDYLLTSGGNKKDRVHIYADEVETLD